MDKTTRLSASQIKEALNIAYKENKLNAYFGNGFEAGVKFAESFYETNVKQLQEENERMREALELIEKECDTDIHSHEVIWGIAFTTLSQKP